MRTGNCETRTLGRRLAGWSAVAWALAVATTALPLATALVPDASAAVLCQRKNKVKLRATACKGKEVLVEDLQQLGANVQQLGTNVQQLGTNVQQLGTDLGTQGGILGTEGARVDGIVDQLRLECSNAPELAKAESSDSFYYDNIECDGGCRTHDGNQTACESAWALSEDGATSCYFFKDFCLPCSGCGEDQGVCTNACREQVVVTCPNDPTRTIFAGGPQTEACQHLKTQVDCEHAFHASRNLAPTSCFWDGDECRGCGPRNENDQDCTNTCRTIGCSDASRTTLRRCESVGNDAVACDQTWHLSGNGGDPASCFFDAGATQCRGCGLPNEIQGLCDNECR